jgi:hypothetical protein
MSEKWHEKHISMQSWERLYKFWLGVAFLIMLGLGVRNCYFHNEITEERISQSSNLQKLDAICKDVGKKGNLEFKGKSVSTKRRDSVSYNYSSYSSQGIFFASDYFQKNGWKMSAKLSTKTSIEFEKAGIYVEIIEQSNGFNSNYSYSIKCGN